MTSAGSRLSIGLMLSALAACATDVPLTDAEKLARVRTMADDLVERFPTVETIDVEEVGRLLESDDVVLIDVRPEDERAVSAIPGAITAEEYESNVARYADVTAVAYCTIGHRSSEYAERHAVAIRRVLNLRGSILAWTHAGGPLVTASGPTMRLHVYGSEWDLAPERYQTIW